MHRERLAVIKCWMLLLLSALYIIHPVEGGREMGGWFIVGWLVGYLASWLMGG